jgi:hypothetical protein
MGYFMNRSFRADDSRLLAIISLVFTIVVALSDSTKKYLDSGDLLAVSPVWLAVWAIVFAYVRYRPPRLCDAPKGKKFHGVISEDDIPRFNAESFWRRVELAKPIVEAIKRRHSSVCFLTGPSGAGKSTLLTLDILPEFEEAKWVVERQSKYDNIKAMRAMMKSP